MRRELTLKMLSLLERHIPEWVIRAQLQILLDTTARGFGVKSRRIAHLSAEEALRAYAEFTVQCVETCMGSRPGRAAQVERLSSAREQAADRTWSDAREEKRAAARRLYREAYRTGSRIRRITGLAESRDTARLVFYLYRNLQISMEGQIPGEIHVADCYFSRMYTPTQCAVMSLVDSGIIAGLCGGGKLKFTERITEGCGRCTACFTPEPAHAAESKQRVALI